MGERGKSEVQLQIFVFTGPCRLSRQKSILARILGNGSSFPLFFCPLQNREIVHTQISSEARKTLWFLFACHVSSRFLYVSA